MALTTEEETKVKTLLEKFDRIGAFLTIDDLKKQLKDAEKRHNLIIEEKKTALNQAQAEAETEINNIKLQIIELEVPE